MNNAVADSGDLAGELRRQRVPDVRQRLAVPFDV
jgi:hypothetical protein